MTRKLLIVLSLLVLPVLTLGPAASATGGFNFQAHLTGDEEVPPTGSDATGQAAIRLSDDESTVSWRLVVANIENVFAAHIHCGKPGENGPVSVTLYGGPLIAGRFDGVLSTGSASVTGKTCVFTEGTVSLVQAMRDGNTYVNVHTSQFPGGEIRGQVSANG